MDTIEKMVSDRGIVAVAKTISERGINRSVDEATFTSLVSEYAQRLYPTLRRDQAFSKLFSADTEEAATIRKAHAVVKNSPMMKSYPIAFGDSPAVAGDNAAVVGDDSSALAELTRRAEKSKRPGESFAAAFARTYSDPSNRDLAAAERVENRPSAA